MCRFMEKIMTSLIESVAEPMSVGGIGLNVSNLDVNILLPVIIIIGISAFFTALWALGVWHYMWIASRHDRQ
jgi:hypothetical protein